VVYPTTVGAFAVGVVPIDSNCRPSGEIFVDACLTARSGDTHTWPVPVAGMLLSLPSTTLQWLERGLNEVNQEWCKHIVCDAPELISQLFCRLLRRSSALVLYTHLIVGSEELGARTVRVI
jgi:hypothetical protein